MENIDQIIHEAVCNNTRLNISKLLLPEDKDEQSSINLVNGESPENLLNLFLEKVRQLEDEFPVYLTNSRINNSAVIIDLPSITERDEAFERIIENHLLVLPKMENSIEMRPNLSTSEDNMNEIINILTVSFRACLR